MEQEKKREVRIGPSYLTMFYPPKNGKVEEV